MSEEKIKITLRVSKSVYDHYKDQKNYQAAINSVLRNEVELESDTYGYKKVMLDNELTKLHEEAYRKIQAIRDDLNQELPYDIKEKDGLAKVFTKLRENNVLNNGQLNVLENLKAHKESQRQQINKLYLELIEAVDARLEKLLPRRYNYNNMYFDELLSGQEASACLIVSVIQMMERYFIGDLYYKDTSFSLKSLSEDDYHLAVIRFYTLIIFVLDTVDDSDVWDDYIKIIEEQGISKKRILEFVFYPIFEMQQAEIEAEAEANSKLPEYRTGIHIYNIGHFNTFEAEILSSFMLNYFINDSLDTIELENKKFRGVDMTMGIEELKSRPFYEIIEAESKTIIKFLPEAYDKYYNDEDLGCWTIEEFKKHLATMHGIK